MHAESQMEQNVLLCGFMISYLLEISISFNNTMIFPFFGCTAIAAFSFYRMRTSSEIAKTDIYFIMRTVMIFLISVLFSFWTEEYFIKRATSLLYISTSLITGFGWFLILANCQTSRVRSFFLKIVLFFIFYGLLERIQVFSDLSNAVRGLLYPEGLLYDADLRDLDQYGAVRPKVFLREPSLVGINAGFSLTIWYLLGLNTTYIRFRALIFFALTLAVVFVARSPTIFYFTLISVAGHYQFYRQNRVEPKVDIVVYSVLTIGVIAPSIFFKEIGDLPILSNISSTWSAYVRMRSGYDAIELMATNVFTLLFGYGIGAMEILKQPFFEILKDASAQYQDVYETYGFLLSLVLSRPEPFIGNIFWQFWLFLGLLPGVLVLVSTNSWMKTRGIYSRSFTFFASLCAGQTLGGFTGLWPMVFLFTFCGIQVLLAKDRENHLFR